MCSFVPSASKGYLADIIPSLKAGGVLIYSTCSYSQEEDEQVGDWLVQEYKVESLRFTVESEWGIVETVSEKEKTFGYRFYPDKVKGEGFFIAAFKKPAEPEVAARSKQHVKIKAEKLTVKEIEILKPWLISPGNFFFFKQNDEVIALPVHLVNELALIQTALYIKKAGVRVGTLIRNELIPAHDLAVSCIINGALTKLETDVETALQYLRKQEIKIEARA